MTESPADVALWFYGDHWVHDFMHIQRLWLDNAWVKWLVLKNKVPLFLDWYDKQCKQCKRATQNKSTEFKTNGLKRKRTGVTYDEYIGHRLTTPHDESTMRRIQIMLKEYGNTNTSLENQNSQSESNRNPVGIFEKLAHVPLHVVQRYMIHAFGKASEACEHISDCMDDVMGYDSDKLMESSVDGFPILLYKRYGGSVMIRGRVGDKSVLFCYGDSSKFEIPSATNHILLGNVYMYTPDDYQLALKTNAGLLARWRATRVAVCDGALYDHIRLSLSGDSSQHAVSSGQPHESMTMVQVTSDQNPASLIVEVKDSDDDSDDSQPATTCPHKFCKSVHERHQWTYHWPSTWHELCCVWDHTEPPIEFALALAELAQGKGLDVGSCGCDLCVSME